MDLDFKKMSEYQNSEDYNKYLKYLNFFYMKEHPKDRYNKEYLEGTYILIEKKHPSKKITITPTEFINIHRLYIELKKYSEVILTVISNIISSKNNITENDRKEFDNLKQKYIMYKEQLNEINIINKDFYDEMDVLLNKKIELSNNLAKYYQKRNNEYSEIKVMIPENLKNKLILIFKENNKKVPSDKQINKIAKENLVASIEIEKWFNWIETVYLYRLVKNDITKITNEIKLKEETYDMNSKYMIIKKPIIKD